MTPQPGRGGLGRFKVRLVQRRGAVVVPSPLAAAGRTMSAGRPAVGSMREFSQLVGPRTGLDNTSLDFRWARCQAGVVVTVSGWSKALVIRLRALMMCWVQGQVVSYWRTRPVGVMRAATWRSR